MVDTYKMLRRRDGGILNLVVKLFERFFGCGILVRFVRSQSLQQIRDQRENSKGENIDQFCGEAIHDCIPYFLGMAAGSFPVLAISSRMPVSACKFFMR